MIRPLPTPLETPTVEPPPAGNDGQLNAVLVEGIETLSRNRPDVTPILEAAKAARSAL